MMSYPNGPRDSYRKHYKPNLRTLAELVEECGLDLRVVVLQRRVRDIFASTVTHRRFRPPLEQAVALIDSANALYSQLHSIDRRFVACIDVFQLKTYPDNEVAAFADFLHPALASSLSDVWRAMMGQIVTPAKNYSITRDEEKLAQHIEKATFLLDSYCHGRP